MALSTNRTPIQWPLFQRFLAIFCVIVFIPLTIAALVVIGLIPVYLTNRAVRIVRTNVAPPFNVTYLLVNPSTRSINDVNLDGIDMIKMADEFEHGLNLPVRNLLKIRHIVSDIAMGMQSKSRRRRFVQCNRDLRGPVLIFEFSLNYPITRVCQNQKCIDQVFAQVYRQFQSILSLFITFGNIRRELSLCSFNVITYQTTQSSGIVTSSVTNNQTSSTTTGASSIGTSGFSTTEVINSTANGNSSMNGTNVDLDVCLRRLPFTQESIPPYRINHTSTLYFQGDNSLIIAGASKTVITSNMGVNKQESKINGEIVYKNCQRTIDLSLPGFCYFAFSS